MTVSALLSCLTPRQATGQFSEGPVQMHGFFSQGYAISDHNNYLTMNTSRGASMSDGGLNLTWTVNPKLRVGAQVYSRYIGELGKGRVSFDWALADYRFRDWLGFRIGKVKTPLGLFNDTQDQEFLYTWALLPQSVYPLDLREMTNAHSGADVYGSLGAKRAGVFSYQLYAGKLPSDYRTGYLYGIQDSGFKNVTYSARTAGYDLRWTTPVQGMTAGFSQMFSQRHLAGELAALPIHLSAVSYMMRQSALYLEWNRGRWRLDAEYRASKTLTRIFGLPPNRSQTGQISPSWFTALSYRVSERLEVGAYRSQYLYHPLFTPPLVLTGPGANHIHDTTATVRLDLTRNWNFKIEGHFIDGFGNVLAIRGFYPHNNRQGLLPTTNMLILRTGINF